MQQKLGIRHQGCFEWHTTFQQPILPLKPISLHDMQMSVQLWKIAQEFGSCYGYILAVFISCLHLCADIGLIACAITGTKMSTVGLLIPDV